VASLALQAIHLLRAPTTGTGGLQTGREHQNKNVANGDTFIIHLHCTFSFPLGNHKTVAFATVLRFPLILLYHAFDSAGFDLFSFFPFFPF